MFIIPLQAVPSQTVGAILGGQQCQINVFQQAWGLFLDLYKDDVLVLAGQFCANLTRIVRSEYLWFAGDIAFFDTQGTSNPNYTGLDDRFRLVYLSADDLVQAESAYKDSVSEVAGLSGVLARYPYLGTSIGTIPALGVLSLSSNTFAASAVQGTLIGLVNGVSPGSSLVLSDSHNSAVQLNNIGGLWQLRVGSNNPGGTTTFQISITETLAGFANSPKTSSMTVMVSVAVLPGVSGSNTQLVDGIAVIQVF